MTRDERAIDMCNRAFDLVATRGGPIDDVTREFTYAGMTIEHSLIRATHRSSPLAPRRGRCWQWNGATAENFRCWFTSPAFGRRE